MRQKEHSFGLHAFATLTAAATLFLICVGGLVTSHGVGLAVPDWPTTFGYNPFFFPFSKWVGGVFLEHSHRLVASGVGLLTVILAAWLWLRETRPWVRRLGLLALFLVILQGVLGGLRVTMLKDELGIFHGALAQLFFTLLCGIALSTSRWWKEARASAESNPAFRRACTVATALIFVQLVLGATMRHQHAGLAIPDFPLAYGSFWPDTTPEAIARYNQLRGETVSLNEITAFQVHLQMAHRVAAFTLLFGIAAIAWVARQRFGRGHFGRRISLLWLGLILIQATLGAATIWTNKSADIATAHVAVGAVSLATGAVLSMMLRRTAVSTVRAWQPQSEAAVIGGASANVSA
jgi:cytochrome c oxidase assembly protein subunit 15